MPPISEQPRAAMAPVSRMAADDDRGDSAPSDIRSAARGLDQSSIMGAELIAALVTWAGIGWLLDRWLDTGPWLLSIGALIGNAAGLYLIWLRSGRMEGFDGATTRFAPGSSASSASALSASSASALSASSASALSASSASTAPSDGADER